jgi:F0F1-type ATP synthase membrane subunit b/b'
MIARLERLSDKMKEKGADVDKLEANIKTLSEKIDKLLADYDTFIKTLKDSRSQICDKDNDRVKDEFKSKIGEARKQIETIRKDRTDIRDFYKTTIKSDLAEIRKQIEDQKSDTESD